MNDDDKHVISVRGSGSEVMPEILTQLCHCYQNDVK